MPDHFHLVHSGGVPEEGALNPDAVGRDAANGEVGVDCPLPDPDDYALEDLDALSSAFDHFDAHPDGVAGGKFGDIAVRLDRDKRCDVHWNKSFSYCIKGAKVQK